MIRILKNLITVFLLAVILPACSLHNFYSTQQPERDIYEQTKCVIKYIATCDELSRVDEIQSIFELNDFLVQFWKKRDVDTTTVQNEFKEEHIARFKYANKYLGGWQTDMGRVYILYGAPYNIINEQMNNLLIKELRDFEVWVYDKATQYNGEKSIFSEIEPGKMKFIFADVMGFGVKSQVYSTEINEYTFPAFPNDNLIELMDTIND